MPCVFSWRQELSVQHQHLCFLLEDASFVISGIDPSSQEEKLWGSERKYESFFRARIQICEIHPIVQDTQREDWMGGDLVTLLSLLPRPSFFPFCPNGAPGAPVLFLPL